MVKNETRRNLLTKLGMGAAAITVMSTAGAAAAEEPKVFNKAKLPVLKASTKIQLSKPLIPQALQVRVAVTPVGVVIDAQAIDKPMSGLANDNRILQLGVILDPRGGVEIQGLNALVDRANQAAAGRCWLDNSKAEKVSNPDPTFESLKASQLAQF